MRLIDLYNEICRREMQEEQERPARDPRLRAEANSLRFPRLADRILKGE